MWSFLRRQRVRAVNFYEEYNRPFWILILGLFIDRLGGALIFPFFTLYITRKFGVSMTEVGLVFGMFAVSGVVGSTLGGALADRFGRKAMLIIGLLASAFSSLAMGLVETYRLFIVVALVAGLFGNIGWPAADAMVADLVPPGKRAGGYGLLRVVANLAVTIGPAIGGLLAAQSYLLLFACDAVSSTITAIIVSLLLRETKPRLRTGQPQETVVQAFGGYFKALRDSAFMWFMLASILMATVYMQMNTTLAPYLRDSHGITEQGFGFIMTLNAGMVVVMQFWITRRTETYRPMIMMALGTFLYAIGFAMYGMVSTYFFFLVAMVVITIGEMISVPVAQVLVAHFAPDDMRGRYMATYGFSWTIAAAVGPLLGGLMLDNFDPRWLWYAAGLLGLVTAGFFVQLGRSGKTGQEAMREPA